MKLSYIVPIVAVVYFGLHILAYYLTPLFIQGVNMNRKEALQIIRNALECYVEDCISQDDELQHKVYEAFEILKTDERG